MAWVIRFKSGGYLLDDMTELPRRFDSWEQAKTWGRLSYEPAKKGPGYLTRNTDKRWYSIQEEK